MVVESGEVGAATGVAHLWLERIRRKIRPLSPDIVDAALMARVRNLFRDVAQQSAK